jgi:ubiquinone/menaquinone biosynthesis C-methylase UbiE
MDTRNAYNNWSATYDTVINKTRDLEAAAIRSVLRDVRPQRVLEIGCGTGKNTGWLAEKCERLIAADFSNDMLQIAREKINAQHVVFKEADITTVWNFPSVDLITCSLVLEHIEDLEFIFHQAFCTLNPGGQFFICELHPYRQLGGSRAKFEQDGKLQQLEYFIHHVSDFFDGSKKAGFLLTELNEWFDDGDKSQPPRLISFLFKKVCAVGEESLSR